MVDRYRSWRRDSEAPHPDVALGPLGP
jgi:hypothetical protein